MPARFTAALCLLTILTSVTFAAAPVVEAKNVARLAPVSERAKKFAEAMKANAKTFRLDLRYNGSQSHPAPFLVVSVPQVDFRIIPPFRVAQVEEGEVIKIIDHLAMEGFLDNAIDLRTKKPGRPAMPGYTMKVVTGDVALHEDLGWKLPMIHRLDALREALPENGQKEMDFLLGRLSFHRKLWKAEKSAFEAAVGRNDSRVQFSSEGDKAIIDIASEFGIDNATIRRNSDEWPKSILVRLHLSGLESFKAGSGNVAVEWSVASTGDHATRTSLVSGLRVARITRDSPYFADVRIVAL